MDKVFLVTCGSYSDYHVVAAFATNEAAEAFLAGCKTTDFYHDWNDIEEYALGLPDDMKEATIYYAKINYETGDMEELPTANGYVGSKTSGMHKMCAEPRTVTNRHGTHVRSTYVEAIAWSAESQEHANKIAAEYRQQHLRAHQ